MAKLITLDDVQLDGRRVLVRVDFNVALGSDNRVDETEDYRIEAALDTINELRQKRCRILLLTHRGEPQQNPGDADLTAVHNRLEELLGESVRMSHSLHHGDVETITNSLEPGGVMLLPNVRTDSREESTNEKFAHELASTADVYVNEAFSVSHRPHVSVAMVPKLLPSCAGRRTVLEYQVLTKLRQSPETPYVAITSGAKITTKVKMIQGFLVQVDKLCVGGQLANVFLAAQGKYKNAHYPAEEVEIAKKIIEQSEDKLVLPIDIVVGEKDNGDNAVVYDIENIPADAAGLWDVGPKTVELFLQTCTPAKTIMWNGPVGLFEVEAYAKSTQALAEGLAKVGAYRVVGGGDTVIALEKAHVRTKYDHVSVGGGAMIALLEGEEMPGLTLLMRK